MRSVLTAMAIGFCLLSTYVTSVSAAANGGAPNPAQTNANRRLQKTNSLSDSTPISTIPSGSVLTFEQDISISANRVMQVIGSGRQGSDGRLRCYLAFAANAENRIIPNGSVWTISSIDARSGTRIGEYGLEIYYPVVFKFHENDSALYCEGFSTAIFEDSPVSKLNLQLSPTAYITVSAKVKSF